MPELSPLLSPAVSLLRNSPVIIRSLADTSVSDCVRLSRNRRRRCSRSFAAGDFNNQQKSSNNDDVNAKVSCGSFIMVTFIDFYCQSIPDGDFDITRWGNGS